MATTTNTNPSRFHNISDAHLADMIGKADAIAKAATAELDALKDEAKRRGPKEGSHTRRPGACEGGRASAR